MNKFILGSVLVGALSGASPLFAAAPAFLIAADGKAPKVFLTGATESQLKYKQTEQTTKIDTVDRSRVQSVFFIEPDSFVKAMRAFQTANFEDALLQFQNCKEEFKDVDTVPGNYSTLAAYFEMECFRLSGQFDKLEAAKEKFLSAPLLRQEFLEQVEFYAAWIAAKDESWERMTRLAEEYKDKTEIGSHKAQMAYLAGLGHHNQGELEEALDNYAQAMIADYGASRNVVKMAYEKSLSILKEDEEVQTAMKIYGTADERPGSLGHRRLLQAGALVKLYQLTFGDKEPLADDLKVFEKFAKS